MTVHGTITASGGDPRAHCTHGQTETVGGLTSCAQCGETITAARVDTVSRTDCTHGQTETVGGLTSCAQCGETVNAGGD